METFNECLADDDKMCKRTIQQPAIYYNRQNLFSFVNEIKVRLFFDVFCKLNIAQH